MILKSYRIYGKDGGRLAFHECDNGTITIEIENGGNKARLNVNREQFVELARLEYQIEWGEEKE